MKKTYNKVSKFNRMCGRVTNSSNGEQERRFKTVQNMNDEKRPKGNTDSRD
jgi:hypothetical protein